MKFSIAFLVFTALLCCQEQQKVTFDECAFYNLKQPDFVWEMPKELDEISGIEIIDNQKVISVNDEQGLLFMYDLKNKSIEKLIHFGKKGDYEDLAIKDSTAFVLRSDGTIFEVVNYFNSTKTIAHKTFLKKQDNTEGLFYDATKNRLLIACKDNADKKTRKYNRLVYEYLLEDHFINPIPILTISLNEINKRYNLKHNIAPSGIAIHPISKNLYVLSSVGKVLLEYTPEGKLQNVFNLNYKHFQQPEGISFDELGNLYISNEAKGDKANILKFNYL